MPRLYAPLLPSAVCPNAGGPYEKLDAEEPNATNGYSQGRQATFGVTPAPDGLKTHGRKLVAILDTERLDFNWREGQTKTVCIGRRNHSRRGSGRGNLHHSPRHCIGGSARFAFGHGTRLAWRRRCLW